MHVCIAMQFVARSWELYGSSTYTNDASQEHIEVLGKKILRNEKSRTFLKSNKIQLEWISLLLSLSPSFWLSFSRGEKKLKTKKEGCIVWDWSSYVLVCRIYFFPGNVKRSSSSCSIYKVSGWSKGKVRKRGREEQEKPLMSRPTYGMEIGKLGPGQTTNYI